MLKVVVSIPECDIYFRKINNITDKYEWDIQKSSDIFKNKRIVLFSLPGAFTPKCTSLELPDYERNYEEFIKYGIDEVVCVSVNDAFVMNMWGKNLGIKNVKMLPDGNQKFTKGMNRLVDKQNLGFGKRSWRYTAIINCGIIEKIFDEEGMMDNSKSDPYDATKPENILKYLKEI